MQPDICRLAPSTRFIGIAGRLLAPLLPLKAALSRIELNYLIATSSDGVRFLGRAFLKFLGAMCGRTVGSSAALRSPTEPQ